MRKIIHIDMDAFFASIEQRDNPEYRGKPMVVGSPEARGVIAAASYEARRYGVFSAMPSKTALRKCPHLIFAPHRFDVYKQVSAQIHAVFHEYTDLVEPLSLDEAFLDVTDNERGLSATEIAKEIKQRIFEETQLTASAGVSFNKFLAKIASDQNKPNGLFVIRPKHAEQFVEQLPIERFFGVGRVTAEKMHHLGITNGADLKMQSEMELVRHFGKMGSMYYQYARGIDERPVEPERERKSISGEETFRDDIDSLEQLLLLLEPIAKDVIKDIDRKEFDGRTVTLKVKYADFKNVSRSKTFPYPIATFEQLYDTGVELLKQVDLSPKVRLLGIGIKKSDSDFANERQGGAVQLQLKFKDWDDKK